MFNMIDPLDFYCETLNSEMKHKVSSGMKVLNLIPCMEFNVHLFNIGPVFLQHLREFG